MLKNILIFLAGAAFFHTISHLMLPYFFHLPMDFDGLTITTAVNNWIIGLSAFLTVLLLWGAKKVSKKV